MIIIVSRTKETLFWKVIFVLDNKLILKVDGKMTWWLEAQSISSVLIPSWNLSRAVFPIEMGMFCIDRANFYAKPQDSPCKPYFFLYIGRIWQRSRLSWVGPLFYSSWNSIHIQNISLIDSILYVCKITILTETSCSLITCFYLYTKILNCLNYYLLPWLAVRSLSSICCISVSNHHHMSIRVPCNAKGSISQYVQKNK